jgi:hypothetical protein
MTFGHGSPPKISGATVTEQEFCPTQLCKEKQLFKIHTRPEKKKKKKKKKKSSIFIQDGKKDKIKRARQESI